LHHEIQQARSMGVHSYPSLRLMHHDAVFPVTVDYLDHRTMLSQITAVIRETDAI
jgi:putative protein-disulfide isomerase